MYFAFRFFLASFSRRRAIVKARRQRQFCLIIGWRSVFDLVWDEGKTLRETLPEEAREKLEGFPFYYRGTQIDPEITWRQLQKFVDPRHSVQIVTRFIPEKVKNFRSMVLLEPSEADIIYFRRSPLYSFLGSLKCVRADSGSDGLTHIEFEILSKMLDRRLWNEKTANFSESRVGWNSVDLEKIDRGDLCILTYQHIYFSLLLLKFVSTRNNTIVEIGGGFGGLARVLEKMGEEFVSNYTIIDLPFVGQLQRYFLSEELGDIIDVNRNVKDKGNKYNLVDVFNLHKIAEDSVFEVAIATHSLTELDPEQINEYLERVLFRSTNILLSMQMVFLQNHFDLTWVVERIEEEGYRCVYQDINGIHSWAEKRGVLTAMFSRI